MPTITDIAKLTDEPRAYWRLRDASPDPTRYSRYFLPYMLGALGYHAQLEYAPPHIDVPGGYFTFSRRLPMRQARNVVIYSGTVVQDGAHYSRWGHGALCQECGAWEGSLSSSSVACEDHPAHFARQHRH